MKKILLVFDSHHYPQSLLDFVVNLHQLKPLSLTAVFLSPMDFSALWAFPIVPGSAGPYIAGQDDVALDEKKMHEHIQRFEATCLKNDITFRVHNDTSGLVFEEIKKESRFADLMLISSEHFYNVFGDQPNEYMKEVIHTSECAVLLLPDSFVFPKRLLLAYDGSASAVFAIKQFAYLLPELSNLDTTLVYGSEKDTELPDQVLAEEICLRHFGSLKLQRLYIKSASELAEWLQQQAGSLVVTGSFGRSAISQLFKKSMLTELIRSQKLPLFIAHK